MKHGGKEKKPHRTLPYRKKTLGRENREKKLQRTSAETDTPTHHPATPSMRRLPPKTKPFSSMVWRETAETFQSLTTEAYAARHTRSTL